MAGAIRLTEVDFDQIKGNLIDYLKSTKEFTDFDFSGSNLQVILNLISYQAQLNAYATNMIANESFLATATIRDNVVANARSVGYLPTSSKSARALITFSFQFTTSDFPSGYPRTIELQPGMVFVAGAGTETFIFNVVDPQTAPVGTGGLCTFSNVTVYEGMYLEAEFTVDRSNYNQKFTLENKNIDTSTIRVEVQENPDEDFRTFYEQADNLVTVSENSRVYWISEVSEEKYELTFGDGFFGRALQNGSKIFVTYLTTSGTPANGIDALTGFVYSGRIITSEGVTISKNATVTAGSTSYGAAALESVNSVKFRAPKYYAAQKRCVTTEDYETIIRQIYPAVQDIYVYGGEELDVPQYGRVFVVIMPTTGTSLSNTTKNSIIESLNEYRVASLQVDIVDPEILYLEIDTTAFYNDRNTAKDAAGIVSQVTNTLSSYFVSATIDKFGGAARFSRIVGAIDDSEQSITRNATKLIMRKDFTIVASTDASYEICFEQNIKPLSVYSTGFRLSVEGEAGTREYFFEDDGLGALYLYYLDSTGTKVITNPTFGTVDYVKGELMIGYVTPVSLQSTTEANSIIKVRSSPVDQDVVAKQSVYLDLDIDSSKINAVIDTNVLSQ